MQFLQNDERQEPEWWNLRPGSQTLRHMSSSLQASPVVTVIYMATVAGNSLVMVLIVADQHFHTPMYFFLGNLSCLETCYTSTILPRILVNLLTGDRTISVSGCITQLYFFGGLTIQEELPRLRPDLHYKIRVCWIHLMAKASWDNKTSVTEFILLGFGDLPELQTLLFLLFLVIYIVTMAGNILIFVLVVTDQHLHTPMYYFLGNLSCLETCCSCTILPRVLASFSTKTTEM
ncbi:olfactory receptor 7G2-like, partial [Mauremys mutica]|uniref:olfactory receptor 7G2-like n=1 Tax=Mauremys mutica TaxID=74926 RepID=UPI001D165141